jgi:hypothetical protein
MRLRPTAIPDDIVALKSLLRLLEICGIGKNTNRFYLPTVRVAADPLDG